MQNNRIDRQRPLVGITSTDAAQPQVAQQKKRPDPHARSGFDHGTGRNDLSALNPEKAKEQREATLAVVAHKPKLTEYWLPSGTRLDIPSLSDADQSEIQRVLKRLSPERQAELARLSWELGHAGYEECEKNPEGAATGQFSSALTSAAQSTYESYTLGTASDRQAQAVADVMFVGVWGVEQNLQGYFTDLQNKQALGDEVRTDVTVIDEMLAEWPDDGSTQTITYHELVKDANGKTTLVEKTEELTKEQAEALRDKLNTQVETAGSISAMDQYKLQYMVQQYNQAMTIVSNVLKVQDETLRGVISNVRS